MQICIFVIKLVRSEYCLHLHLYYMISFSYCLFRSFSTDYVFFNIFFFIWYYFNFFISFLFHSILLVLYRFYYEYGCDIIYIVLFKYTYLHILYVFMYILFLHLYKICISKRYVHIFCYVHVTLYIKNK